MSLYGSVKDEMQLKVKLNQVLINQNLIMGVLDEILHRDGWGDKIRDCLRESAKLTEQIIGVGADENENS